MLKTPAIETSLAPNVIAWLVVSAENSARTVSLSLQENTIDISFSCISLVFGIVIGWIGFSYSFAVFAMMTMVFAGILFIAAARKI